MQNLKEKIIPWIKNNSGRLLLFAVILTGCFAVKYAAYGKYVDYLNDYTSVTAAPFYFSSNYLGEKSEGRSYDISTFDGSKIDLDVEIKNFDNAFNFNEKGADSATDRCFYYYVTVELYVRENPSDPESRLIPYSGSYDTWVKYGKDNEYAAAMARAAKVYELASDSQVPITSKNIIIDNGPSGTHDDDYNDPERYKVVGRMDGIDYQIIDGRKVADVTKASQTVSIMLRFYSEVEQTLYVDIMAHVLPPTTTSNSKVPDQYTCITKISQEDMVAFGENLFKSGYRNAYTQGNSCPNVYAGYQNVQGIYATDLIARFNISKSSSGGAIQAAGFSKNDYNYEVYYVFTASENLQADVFYPSQLLVPDDSLGTPTVVDETLSYVTVPMYAGGSKTCYFYKTSLSVSDQINKDSVYAEVHINP